MTEEQRKEAEERIQREVEAIGSVLRTEYVVQDLLTIKCLLEDWRQWVDVVASKEATTDHLWKIVQKIIALKEKEDEALEEQVYQMLVNISYHENVKDRLLKAVIQNFQFTEWVKMDWSKAETPTLVLLAEKIKIFERTPWLIQQVLPLVEQLRAHKNTTEEIKKLFDTPEWSVKAS